MARVPITEYAAKRLLLGEAYRGYTVTPDTVDVAVAALNTTQSYVVKVDVGIKKRGLQGLLRLNVAVAEIAEVAHALFSLGHNRCIVEPMSAHDSGDEKYLSINLTRDGAVVLQSDHGGIAVEDAEAAALQTHDISRTETIAGSTTTSIPGVPLNDWLALMQQYHLSFLEINPYIITGDTCRLLDLAAEIDSTKANRLPDWIQEHILYKKASSDAERAVLEQDARTQAALNLHTLNPNGAILTLFSGGGASLVGLDALVTADLSDQVINYSEYSGAPTRDETAAYVKNLLSVLFASTSDQKVILIAGGVANFTDVLQTFQGIVDAFGDDIETIKTQNISVVVRRGGPNQAAGLAHLRAFLESHHIAHEVHDPSLSLGAVGTLVQSYL